MIKSINRPAVVGKISYSAPSMPSFRMLMRDQPVRVENIFDAQVLAQFFNRRLNLPRAPARKPNIPNRAGKPHDAPQGDKPRREDERALKLIQHYDPDFPSRFSGEALPAIQYCPDRCHEGHRLVQCQVMLCLRN